MELRESVVWLNLEKSVHLNHIVMEYSLTDLGKSLIPVMGHLFISWSMENYDRITEKM